MATLSIVSGVIGSRLAAPRTPSVPKSLRVVEAFKLILLSGDESYTRTA
jgi:hypothetical protein